MDRVDLTDRLEQICWYLNHHEGETLDSEEIADQLGIEWGEAHNSIVILDRLQRIIPEIEGDGSTVTIKNQHSGVSELFSNNYPLAFFLFHTSLTKHGSPVEPLNREEYKETIEMYSESIDEMVEKELIELTDQTIQLTPKCVGKFGNMQSKYANCPS